MLEVTASLIQPGFPLGLGYIAKSGHPYVRAGCYRRFPRTHLCCRGSWLRQREGRRRPEESSAVSAPSPLAATSAISLVAASAWYASWNSCNSRVSWLGCLAWPRDQTGTRATRSAPDPTSLSCCCCAKCSPLRRLSRRSWPPHRVWHVGV
ncbi:hypothetical protein MTO96_034681 [Rhipicephalus appendiculatus]